MENMSLADTIHSVFGSRLTLSQVESNIKIKNEFIDSETENDFINYKSTRSAKRTRVDTPSKVTPVKRQMDKKLIATPVVVLSDDLRRSAEAAIKTPAAGRLKRVLPLSDGPSNKKRFIYSKMPEQSKKNSDMLTSVNVIVENATTVASGDKAEWGNKFKDPKLINFSYLTPDKLCRICGRISETELTPIYSDWSIRNSIPDVINDHLPIEVSSKQNMLPSNMCPQCVSLVLDWRSLMERSLRTNDWLHNVFEVPLSTKNISPSVPTISKDANSNLSSTLSSDASKSLETIEEVVDEDNVEREFSDNDSTISKSDDNISNKTKDRRNLPKTKNTTSKGKKSKYIPVKVGNKVDPVIGTWKAETNETIDDPNCDENGSNVGQIDKKYMVAKQVRYKILSLTICDKETVSSGSYNNLVESEGEEFSDEENTVKVSSPDDSNKENQLDNIDKQGSNSGNAPELSRYVFVDETDYEPDSTLLVPAAIIKASEDYILRERYNVDITLINRNIKKKKSKRIRGEIKTISSDTIEKIHIVLSKELNSKKFGNKSKQFKQTNTKLAIFNCPYCVYHDMTATEFGRHMKTSHSNRPFICPICSAVFKEDYNLIIHLQVTSCSKKISLSDDEDMVDGDLAEIAKHLEQDSLGNESGLQLADLNVYFRLLHLPVQPDESCPKNGKGRKVNIEYLSTCNYLNKRKSAVESSSHKIAIETWKPAKSNVLFEPGFVLLNTSYYFDAQLNSLILTEIGKLMDMTMFSLFDCNCLRTVIGSKVVDVVESLESDKVIKVKLSVSTKLDDKNLPIIKTMESDIGNGQDNDGNQPRKSIKGYPSLKEIFGTQPKPVLYKPKQEEAPDVKCHVCDEYFSNTDDRRKHKRIHHTEVKCGHCDQMFANLIMLWDHRAEHNIRRNLSLNCDKCNLKFDTMTAMRKHNLIVHQIGESFKCVECNKKFASKLSFRNHKKNVHASQLNLCPYCGQLLKTRAALRCHIKDRHMAINKGFECSVCQKRYKSKQKLKCHLLEHKDEKEVFPCPTCGKHFNSKETLKQHQHVHEVKPVTHCAICGIGYNRSSRLPVHLKNTHWTSVNKPASEQFPCLICGIMLESGDSLFQHMMFYSEDTKILKDIEGSDMGKWKCRDCGKCVLTKKFLALHRFFMHKDLPFSCTFTEICKETFWSKAALDEHIIKEHDGVPCACHICNQEFSSRKKMDLHLRAAHKETVSKESYSCDVCGKEFRNAYTLDMHSVTHSDVKQHSCDRCGRRFSLPQILAKHMLWHKREDERLKKDTFWIESNDVMEDVVVEDGVHQEMEIADEFIVDHTSEVEVVASTSMGVSSEMYKICTMYNCSECNIMFKNKDEYELHCSKAHSIVETIEFEEVFESP